MARQPKNAIERRLDYLAGLWGDFASNEKARLLRWLTDQEGARMLEVFFETQNEETSELPDLFIRLNVPFTDAAAYGYQLASALQQIYEESRAELKREGIDADWFAPDPARSRSGIEAFAACGDSLRTHYKDTMTLLAIALEPEEIADRGAWQLWLRFMLTYLPDSVRLTCLDRVDAPALSELADLEPDAVITVEPLLDMAAAQRELLREAGGQGPGVEFRRLFLELAQAGPAADPAIFAKKANAALKIATDQRWFSQIVTVQMLAAAYHFGAQRSNEAITAYRLAAVAAGEAKTAGDPAADKLLLQSRFGETAVLVGDGDFRSAAQLYETIAPAATGCGESQLAFEAWRMAGYCWQQAGAPARSWELYWQSLDAAATLDEQARRASALPFAGLGLLELAGLPVYRTYVPTIESRMAELCGDDWHELAEAALR